MLRRPGLGRSSSFGGAICSATIFSIEWNSLRENRRHRNSLTLNPRCRTPKPNRLCLYCPETGLGVHSVLPGGRVCTKGRQFICIECGCEVVVCDSCDRGPGFCSDECRTRKRRRDLRKAGKRYRQTRRAQEKNAERQSRYRQKKRAEKNSNASRFTGDEGAPNSSGDGSESSSGAPERPEYDGTAPYHCVKCLCGVYYVETGRQRGEP